MNLLSTAISGVFLVEIEPIEDERGFFARFWSADDFSETGIEARWEQANLGYSHRKGTLRGMHYQRPPYDEHKLVWCAQGALFDVAVDLRADSPTYLTAHAEELKPDTHRALLIPPGCAHGYQTLADRTELWYLTSKPYNREAAAGVRHDDPAITVKWPLPISVISAQDANWPLVTKEVAER